MRNVLEVSKGAQLICRKHVEGEFLSVLGRILNANYDAKSSVNIRHGITGGRSYGIDLA
jgi:hypothetical protein